MDCNNCRDGFRCIAQGTASFDDIMHVTSTPGNDVLASTDSLLHQPQDSPTTIDRITLENYVTIITIILSH